MGTKNNPGDFDCYENAEPDEPMFVLLARDPQAPWLVRHWAWTRATVEGNREQISEAVDCAEDMEDWRRINRDDVPPASTRYLIWSFEHGGWWGPGHIGYVAKRSDAGEYSEVAAMAIVEQANIITINEALVPITHALGEDIIDGGRGWYRG